jgi:hypothetical protein
VDQCEVEVETVGESGGTLGSSGIGGYDHCVFVVEVLADVAEGEGLCVEAVVSSVSTQKPRTPITRDKAPTCQRAHRRNPGSGRREGQG